jgi:hypothetical protein
MKWSVRKYPMMVFCFDSMNWVELEYLAQRCYEEYEGNNPEDENKALLEYIYQQQQEEMEYYAELESSLHEPFQNPFQRKPKNDMEN